MQPLAWKAKKRETTPRSMALSEIMPCRMFMRLQGASARSVHSVCVTWSRSQDAQHGDPAPKVLRADVLQGVLRGGAALAKGLHVSHAPHQPTQSNAHRHAVLITTGGTP